MPIQSILFNKNKWTIPKAKEWLKDNKFVINYSDGQSPRVTRYFLRFRQSSPKKYKNYITKDIPNGILIIVGYN